MSQQMSELVITKSVTIAAPVEHAIRVFTEEIHTWSPLRSHAVDTEHSEIVLFERTPSGEEHLWGTVVLWEPPGRVGYSWHPGRSPETGQEVEVTFTRQGEGTRVDVRHWGWEKLGERLDETIASYNDGWDLVLGRYVEAANA